MLKAMGVISRKIFPACGNMCVCCHALRSRSCQSVKRYRKLLADIFPKSPGLLYVKSLLRKLAGCSELPSNLQGLLYAKSLLRTCAICLNSMKQGQGHAILYIYLISGKLFNCTRVTLDQLF